MDDIFCIYLNNALSRRRSNNNPANRKKYVINIYNVSSMRVISGCVKNRHSDIYTRLEILFVVHSKTDCFLSSQNVVIVPGLVPVMFTYVGSHKMAFIEATHLKR